MRYIIIILLTLFSMSLSAQFYSKDLEKRAKKGETSAQYETGLCYLKGLGITSDRKKAAKWLQNAAEQNHAEAMYELALISKEDGSADWKNQMTTAANLGSANAQYAMYRETNQKDWLVKAAANRHADALYDMASLETDIQKKLEWLDLAAAQGHYRANGDAKKLRKNIEKEKEERRMAEERKMQEEQMKKKEEELQRLLRKYRHISLKKPSTLLSVIPLDVLGDIDSLTIVGFMYETDTEVITKECKNLRYLDISNTVTMMSPEALRKKQESTDALKNYIKAMGIVADAKFWNGEMGAVEYVYAKMFTDIEKIGNKVTKSEDVCVIPHNAFNNMYKLETVILPARCWEIGQRAFQYCEQLKKVVLPKYLERIHTGAFSNCANLTSIDFPATITYMGEYSYGDYIFSAFANTPIQKIDLSKCKNFSQRWLCSLTGCGSLRELHFPSNLKVIEQLDEKLRKNSNAKFYIPATVNDIGGFAYRGEWENVEIHFKGATPPSQDKGSVKNSTVYVPKGCTTAYYARFGNTNKYIEE